MARLIKRGKEAEEAAVNYLAGCGYEILAQNVRIGGGEIDIVARDGDELVIVEVRSGTGSIDPLLSIGRNKQRQLRKLALCVAQRYGDRLAIRIDVIGATRRPGRFDLEHLQAAI